jgi:hypothetical protein
MFHAIAYRKPKFLYRVTCPRIWYSQIKMRVHAAESSSFVVFLAGNIFSRFNESFSTNRTE